MAQIALLASEITYVETSFNVGWDHGTNRCRVGTLDIHKIADPYGIYYDGGVTVADADQGHLHSFWADNTGPNQARLRGKVQPIGPFRIERVKLLVRVWRSGGTYTGAQFRPGLLLRSDPTDPMTAGDQFIAPADWETPPVGGDIDSGFVKAPFGGPNVPGQYFTGTIYLIDYGTENPATEAGWQRNDINTLEWIFDARNQDDVYGTGPFFGVVHVLVLGTGAAEQQEQAHEMASRYEWLHHAAHRELQDMPVPYRVSRRRRIGDILQVAHFAGPHPSGYGWGVRPDQLRPFLIREIELRDDGFDQMSGLDWEELAVLYLDTMLMKSNINTATEDGILRISNGQARSYARAGQAWERDPGSGLYVQLEANERPYAASGVGCFGAYKNHVPYSAFKTGDIDGWAKHGDGTNGSEIVVDDPNTGAELGETYGWDARSTGVTRSVLMIAGDPHTTDLYIEITTPSLVANTPLCPQSLWTRYVQNQPGYMAVKRDFDDYWLGPFGWQSTIYWWDMTVDMVGAGDFAIDRTGSNEAWTYGYPTDSGDDASTFTIRMGLPTGLDVADNQATRFYYGGLADEYLVAAPPILNEASMIVERQPGLIKIENTIANPIRLADQGVFGIRVTPAFWGSWLPNDSFRCAAYGRYDDDNEITIGYYYNRAGDGFTGWSLKIVSATTVYESKISTESLDVWPKLPVDLIARMTGSVGRPELTAALFLIGMDAVDPGIPHVIQIENYGDGPTGIKNDVAFVAPIAADGYLELGSRLEANHFGGHVQFLKSSARVLTDAQCVRFLR